MKKIEIETQTGPVAVQVDGEIVSFNMEKGLEFKMTKHDAGEFQKMLKAIL